MDSVPPVIEKRPPALMVCGIINLVFAAILASSLVGVAVLYVVPGAAESNPVLTLARVDPVYGFYLHATQVLGVIALLVLVLSAVGLFRGREWARKLVLVWAVYAILATPVVTYMQMKYIHPMVLAQVAASGKLQHRQLPADMEKTTETIMAGVMYVAYGAGALFSLAYPIAAWVLLTRPKVKAYCRRQQEA